LAWHFCTNKNSKKLEKVQERALRFVYEDYNSSYEDKPEAKFLIIYMQNSDIWTHSRTAKDS
jgi:hypothetical protein